MAQAASATTAATMAPRARAMTAEQWTARARALAEQHHTSWHIQWHGRNEAGEYVYSCPSKTQSGRFYAQCVNPNGLTVYCGCEGHAHGLACCHAGAALQLFREMTCPTWMPDWMARVPIVPEHLMAARDASAEPPVVRVPTVQPWQIVSTDQMMAILGNPGNGKRIAEANAAVWRKATGW